MHALLLLCSWKPRSTTEVTLKQLPRKIKRYAHYLCSCREACTGTCTAAAAGIALHLFLPAQHVA
jgi:hypothetical protein